MDFRFTEEQQLLRDTVRKFCRDHGTLDERLRGLTPDQDNWSSLADLGLLALPFSADVGGLGGSMIDVMVVMEEFGRALMIEPYLASIILAGGVLKRVPDALRCADIIAPLMSGEKKYALAYYDDDNRFSLNGVNASACASEGSYVVNGSKAVVLAGSVADAFIVSARLEGADGISLFFVPRDSDGVTLTPYRTVDGYEAADVTFDNVAVPSDGLLGDPGAGLALLEPAMDDAIVALGAEAVGVMAFVNEATVEYARTRKQFGVPISSFQVLQHRMVDMFVEREQTVSILYKAAMLADGGGHEARKAACALKIQLGKACRLVGQQAVQLHGGMGIAEETPVAHYFKRLSVMCQQFGGADFHARRYAELTRVAAA